MNNETNQTKTKNQQQPNTQTEIKVMDRGMVTMASVTVTGSSVQNGEGIAFFKVLSDDVVFGQSVSGGLAIGSRVCVIHISTNKAFYSAEGDPGWDTDTCENQGGTQTSVRLFRIYSRKRMR